MADSLNIHNVTAIVFQAKKAESTIWHNIHFVNSNNKCLITIAAFGINSTLPLLDVIKEEDEFDQVIEGENNILLYLHKITRITSKQDESDGTLWLDLTFSSDTDGKAFTVGVFPEYNSQVYSKICLKRPK